MGRIGSGENQMKHLKDLFKFIYYIIGNIIQVFIIVIFVDFMSHRFKEWMINFYVATNCNYTVFDKMIILLIISIVAVTLLGIARYIWFRFRYLKKTGKLIKRKSK